MRAGRLFDWVSMPAVGMAAVTVRTSTISPASVYGTNGLSPRGDADAVAAMADMVDAQPFSHGGRR